MKKSKPAAALAIGASVGAIDALFQILTVLPADFGKPVLIVVHLPPDRASGLPRLFSDRCRLPAKEAEDKERIEAGKIYFAPPDYHLLVEPDFHFALSSEEPVNYSRPAIDPLFESAADAWGGTLTGVILTGASSDGAAGLAAVCREGGRALVQHPEFAECGVMPEAALIACPGAIPMSLEEIARALLEP